MVINKLEELIIKGLIQFFLFCALKLIIHLKFVDFFFILQFILIFPNIIIIFIILI